MLLSQFDNYKRLVEETKTLSPEELTAKVSDAEQIRNNLWKKALAEATVTHPGNPQEARKLAQVKQSETISALNPETRFYLDFPAAMSSIGLYQESRTALHILISLAAILKGPYRATRPLLTSCLQPR